MSEKEIEGRSRTEESFRLLVASVRDYAIFLLDPTGHVMSWNIGAERAKGYTAAEIIGKHFSIFYQPEDVGKCAVELEGAVREGRFEDEGWRLRKDGSRFWANVVITAVRDASGTLVGFAKVTRDLTERVRAEAARIDVARMHEAEKRNREVLAIMGHELRNPLAPMVTALRLIRLRGGQATEKELAIMDRQVSHMNRLVDDLLDASRSMNRKMELAPQLIEVGEALTSAIDMTKPMIESRKHRVSVRMSAEDLTVSADTQRLAQVFGNLLSNAAKYTPPGGLIEITAQLNEGQVEVAIKDNGQGIAPSLMPRIFDFFSQGEQGLDRSLGGMGIGLGLADLLVKQHGGRLAAHSDGPGKGSVFTVSLPRAPAKPDAAEDLVDSASRPVARRRVLIVDDNVDAADLLQTYLQDRGHEVVVAHDGPSALTTLDTYAAEIMFVDIGMPNMSGYHLARLVRQRTGGNGIRLIGLSGYPRDLQREQEVPLGFTAHLHKPVDLDTLETFLAG